MFQVFHSSNLQKMWKWAQQNVTIGFGYKPILNGFVWSFNTQEDAERFNDEFRESA